ncbi:glycosyl hydrolase 115 family protein [Adhaeribacter aquaticus]|uniref:glycosyl hydrolase 115 family protein n=1 Tax=Adhaeribacter aquaticus TaxID=299567 RepID=UPI00041215F0|nr:glycosyl hydrolase 115 family protein [Adhaeribacter aquaticus]
MGLFAKTNLNYFTRLLTVLLLASGLILASFSEARAITGERYVSGKKAAGSFTLASAGKPAPLFVSSQDFPGVIRVAKTLQSDIKSVTSNEPKLVTDKVPAAKEVILIGTIGKNPVIDKLVKEKKLNVTEIAGKWETFLLQVVEKPMPGVDRALVIAGSDKRGTIYGMFDLSAQIGVSPWYYWADVPVKPQANLFVLPGQHTQGEPKVKYRGIFINDEAPALTGWSKEKFGGFNAQFYEKVFELILRMKGNYLWPAMWGSAFYDDDKENAVLADEYGVVIGTTHHEPLMRAHDEWRRYGKGAWNYQTNKKPLQAFWRQGIQRMGEKESIISLGMRGDGDEPMSRESNIALLERIVSDQRKIIEDVTGKPASATPQLWALYKEVQEYYDKGMRVPDDVTLLLCDDNWGNIRKLPKIGEPKRPGGYGIYYHYDYVGGPRNYKWLNTNPIPRIWEQMNLAYQHGVDRIWIVNVGDIKPVEFPIEFFLDFAWNPDKITANQLGDYTRAWAANQFGPANATAIADILAKYAKYNSRRKPEMLAANTYSLVNFREAEKIVTEYNRLAERAEKIYQTLPENQKDAYYQLVLYPVKASANLNELWVTVGKNRLYAKQGRASTNDLAVRANALFAKDQELAFFYNKKMANGKWNHMMDQTHISYTSWQQPEKDEVPKVENLRLYAANMGMAIEGSEAWWPAEKTKPTLPELTPFSQKNYFIDIFNRGQNAFDFTVKPGASWLQLSSKGGRVERDHRVLVSVDWAKAPTGKQQVPIIITGPDDVQVVVQATINKPANLKPEAVMGFVESNGYISMEAVHFTKAVNTEEVKWKRIPDLGRTLSAMTVLPVTAPAQKPGGNGPALEYRINTFSEGPIKVHAYFAPTLNHNIDGLRYAVSIDEEEPQIVNLHTDMTNQTWEQWVGNNIMIHATKHQLAKPGAHVVKFWMVDPGVVLQKLVVETTGVPPSYLGPPESFFR